MKKNIIILVGVVLLTSFLFITEIKADEKDAPINNLPGTGEHENHTIEEEIDKQNALLQKNVNLSKKQQECNKLSGQKKKDCEKELVSMEKDRDKYAEKIKEEAKENRGELGDQLSNSCIEKADKKCDECKAMNTVDKDKIDSCVSAANESYYKCGDNTKKCTIDKSTDRKDENEKNKMELLRGCTILETEFGQILSNILKVIRVIGVILCVLFGILDFVKSVTSGNDDNIKKYRSNFFKRLIAVVILLLLPAFLDLIFNNITITSDKMCKIE